MNCRIKKQGLQMVIDVDGQTVHPSAYMTYCPEEDTIEEFKRYGIKLFMFPVYAGDEGINMESGLRPLCDHFFKGIGEYDFTAMDEMMEMLASSAEEEIYIIPRVCLEPPKWWQQLYPQEAARDYRGEPQRECFASEKWRQDMTVALKALIDHVEASKWKKNVIGYHIAAGGTEEWAYQSRYCEQYYDYSLPNLRAYQAFLKEKYDTTEKISAAWDKEISCWEEVSFPLPIERTYAKEGFVRNPECEQHVLDYYDFHNEIVADTIIYFCRQVKEYTKNTRLTGAFYGYVYSMPHNKKGLHALRELVASPYIDFLSTTNEGNGPGDAWRFSSAVASALLHGKMWIAEGDIRTCYSKENSLMAKLPHAAPDNDYYGASAWVGPSTPELSCSGITKALARILMTPCGIWWFDMFGRWFQNPRMMEIISNTEKLLQQQTHEYLKPEIAVLLDERGHKYSGVRDRHMAQALREAMANLSHIGAPYHNYLLSDILEDYFPEDDYKLYIIVAAVHPTEEEAEAVNRKLKQKGKTILWLHTASCYRSELCDFKLKPCFNAASPKAVYEGIQYPLTELPIWNFAEGEEGYVLSRFAESREPAVLWKQFEEYASVYSLHLAPPTELLREIALLSGIHLYNLTGDCVFAGGEFVGIHAVEAGYRRINLPESGFSAHNALSGDEVTVNDMFIDLKLEKYDTVILHVEKKQDR